MLAQVGEQPDTEPSREPALAPAPRGRRAIAGLVDAALWSVPLAIKLRQMRRGEGTGDGGERAKRARRAATLGWGALGQQLGTPGQRIVGLRTVDRRTGRRLALWRSLAVAGVALAGDAIASGLRSSGARQRPDPQERERAVRAIREAHRRDEAAANRALTDYFREHQGPPIDLTRLIYVPLAVNLVQSRLRKRLAPTTVVRREQIGERDQSP
jgi:hypothetical protein